MAKKKGKTKQSKPTNIDTESIQSQVIAAALSSVNQPALGLKLCRLCESKDGPFLNIFDSETTTAKKVDELLPFVIAENDDLPHKICFRCSAKVEELHEFVQKCVKTQESLALKTSRRKTWEEQLSKNNMSNNDVCDAIIKKAMEGVQDIPTETLQLEGVSSTLKKEEKKKETLKESKTVSEMKNLKISVEKCDNISSLNRSNNNVDNLEGFQRVTRNLIRSLGENNTSKSGIMNFTKKSQKTSPDESVQRKKSMSGSEVKEDEATSQHSNVNKVLQTNQFQIEDSNSSNSVLNIKSSQEETNPQEKPFDIMDHISMIKVNGVGVLFQCKLCNRNFLKKEIVTNHPCARNKGPIGDIIKNVPPPEPPKISTIKYINTKTDPIKKPSPGSELAPVSEIKRKPKIGPASKTRPDNEIQLIGMTVSPKASSPPAPLENPIPEKSNSVYPAFHISNAPNLKSTYKLIPGPANTFTLIEDKPAVSPSSVSNKADISEKESENLLIHRKRRSSHRAPAVSPSSVSNKADISEKESENLLIHRKRRASYRAPAVSPSSVSNKADISEKESENLLNHRKRRASYSASNPDQQTAEDMQVRNVETGSQPYPVGLYTSLPHVSKDCQSRVTSEQAPFTTPAMKKQSYTIVQTGNPSKLLISTKPQTSMDTEPAKKRIRKSKPTNETEANTPYSVTLEDAAPPKDAGFFTFINVDPLLQPSYVLPTDNIIQESQISTSSSATKTQEAKVDDKYSCNMCGQKFSREKKLLSHILSHYNKMDEEDQQRAEKTDKKRSKRT